LKIGIVDLRYGVVDSDWASRVPVWRTAAEPGL
jgi:hypothetical protein